MFDSEIKLISRTPTGRDNRGQVIYSEQAGTVLCEAVPVSRDEYFKGAEIGINPEYLFKINPCEYAGETIIEFEGRRFSIYRKYRTGPDELELYAEYTTGINGGPSDDD